MLLLTRKLFRPRCRKTNWSGIESKFPHTGPGVRAVVEIRDEMRILHEKVDKLMESNKVESNKIGRDHVSTLMELHQWHL